MSPRKTIVVLLTAMLVGFAGGFVLRPVIAPAPAVRVASRSPAVQVPSDVRGTQYFVAHIDEARQVVAGCRGGSVRGGECATAEEAIIKVDSADRRRKFLGN